MTRRVPTTTHAVTVLVAALIAAGCSSSKGASLETVPATVPIATVAATVATTLPPAPTVAAPTTTVAPTTTSTTTTTTTTLPPTTTTIPIVTEGAIVIVANAAGVPGAAARLTDRLGDLGFTMKEPTNAAGTEAKLDATKVYFLPPAAAAANSLGLILGGVPVTPMPTPAPIVGATIGLEDANILLMLGADLVDKGLPGIDS